jgi:predicted transcriptional regulator
MLKTLIDKPANISELAECFSLPLSSAALHVRVLKDAGLIFIQEKKGIRGSQKICAIFFEDLYLNMAPRKDNKIITRDISFRMPLGNYFDCSVSPPCGIAGSKGPIGVDDASFTFYSPARTHAQLIWFTSGYLEYRFGTMNIQNKKILGLIFSFEVCSEAAGYNNDWPSDITVWVNGEELYKFRSSGDFGGRRGLYTPPWWPENSSQYGELHHLEINENGSFGNGIKCSDLNLEAFHIARKDFISFKIGVKDDAEYVGGMNIFGEHFGDYNQNIEMVAKLER